MPDDFKELETLPGLGHNAPPSDLKSGVELKQSLDIEHVALVTRANEMLQMAADFHADHPSVEDDETSGVLAGVIRQILGHAKSVDQVRIAVKDPYLRAEKIIDNFFTAEMKNRLESAAADLNKKQTAYQRAKEDRRRREAEEAAAKARAEEDARRREAEKAERERQRAEREARRVHEDAAAAAAARQRAQEAERRAQEAREAEERAKVEREAQQQTAGASAADLSRTRGDYAMASLRTTWDFEIDDITKVPAEYLQINTSMVRAAIRGKDGKRSIPGLRIFSVKTAQNR
jgi:hypothetical protein